MEIKTQIPRVASITQCTSITGLSYSTIRTLIIKNKIKYVRVGKKYLVNLESLAAYLGGENEKEE